MPASGATARFGFGENWREFLTVLDEGRVREAEASLTRTLRRPRFDGLRFLDVGCGSGLFSLAARRLGATVHSFDFDEASVACTTELKRRFATDDSRWEIERGDILDEPYIAGLGTFDIVYAWGVLHHTGDLRRAMRIVASTVREGGTLWLALYNDQGWRSRAWHAIKRLYNATPRPLRSLILLPALVRLWGPTMLRDIARGRPFESWRSYRSPRGMSPWYDVVDWVGGYPFEVARPDDVVALYDRLGFDGEVIVRRDGIGCNEYLFERRPLAAHVRA